MAWFCLLLEKVWLKQLPVAQGAKFPRGTDLAIRPKCGRIANPSHGKSMVRPNNTREQGREKQARRDYSVVRSSKSRRGGFQVCEKEHCTSRANRNQPHPRIRRL